MEVDEERKGVVPEHATVDATKVAEEKEDEAKAILGRRGSG